ncbi:gamma-glutamyltransferase [Ruania suaedae]|uniref:gamma-glutamyltransferase family protein n=1 Tax=Ruania suaedae TaxID=2897774 RepID=UPI001E40635C|nr:gamma-glutamyltransferase [Ruania suaedae]UFU03002.1 gamma-glutamyltransferase [Ruania suaedae]
MRRATRALTAAPAALALVLAGCTAPDETPQESPTASSAPPGPTAEPSPEPTTEDPEPPPPALAEHGVSAAHPRAVDAGMRILEQGGTAVDAAIATAFAVSVVEPFASGIGGGGSAIVAPTGGRPESYDYREEVGSDGRVPASGTGIPGFVAGMAELHEQHGEVAWEDLLDPAVALAEDGFEVSDFLALRMRSDYGPGAVGSLGQFAPGGALLEAGERLVQEDLATTLRAIAADGSRAFYEGALAGELARVEGIDAAALAGYETVRSDPVSGQVGDYEVVSAAPALPGAALVQMLQVAESGGAGEVSPSSADYVETLSRAWLVAEETANTVMGDPAFVEVPVEELTDPGANADRAAQVISAPSSAMREPAPPQGVTAGNTTHLTVVDSDGLMVSMTNTLTNFWGSGDMVAGFFLNNQLSRFEAISSTANTPEAGRRSVSWSLPTVVLDAEGRPVLGIGSPGGRQIPNILATVITRWALHGQSLEEAVAAPRFILDGTVLVTERQPPAEVTSQLNALGWSVEVVPAADAVFGSVQALEVDHESGQVRGAADERREADVEIAEP